jgi:chemotaxis protein methyltransferase CheR
MEESTFNTFREIVYDRSGISINANKIALVTARVGKRMRELGMDDDRAYLKHIVEDESGEEIVHLLDVISTNVTSFFREGQHFELVGEYFEKWYEAGQRRFRFWSAASSSGEEPYTLAMTLLERLDGRSAEIKILATDISTRILRKAIRGVYPAAKVETVPPALRSRYFEACATEKGTAFSISAQVRELIAFRRLNLSQVPFPMSGPMDAIFCRNVMIYFDNLVRKRLLDEAFRLLKPGGYLFVGHAESLTGMLSGFKPVVPSVYVKT